MPGTDVESRLAVLESNMACLLGIKEEFIAHTARHREDVLQLSKDLLRDFMPRSELERMLERLERRTANIPPWVTVVVGLMMAFLGALIAVLMR